jgi:hypothetical protein
MIKPICIFQNKQHQLNKSIFLKLSNFSNFKFGDFQIPNSKFGKFSKNKIQNLAKFQIRNSAFFIKLTLFVLKIQIGLIIEQLKICKFFIRGKIVFFIELTPLTHKTNGNGQKGMKI